MRKILFIGVFAMLLGSCSADSPSDTNSSYYNDYVPIATVEMPEAFEFGQSYVIEYTYYKPTTCHLFNDLIYDDEANVHTIIIRNTVLTGGGADCQSLTNEVVSKSFDFVASNTSTHYFKFWKGLDDSCQDIFLEFEVPVN